MSMLDPVKFTVVLDVVNLYAVPLMSEPLCIKLNPIVVLTLLKEMRIKSCYIDDIALKQRVVIITM